MTAKELIQILNQVQHDTPVYVGTDKAHHPSLSEFPPDKVYHIRNVNLFPGKCSLILTLYDKPIEGKKA